MSDLLSTQALQDRLNRLEELTEFTEKYKKELCEILDTLGWSLDHKASPQGPLEQCPYDPNHRVPVGSMEKHTRSCKLKLMGYSAQEQAEMCDPSVCYENTKVQSFVMDKSTQHQVILQARSAAPMMKMEGVFWQGEYSSQPVDVPQNHKRAVCDLTVADRLALYDHVVGVFSQQKETGRSNNDDLYVDLASTFQKDEEKNKPKTHLELLAEMRDYKRRRQSYRAKNVHITKKTYTEVIREVISVHSEELSRQWREEEEDEKQSMRSGRSSHSWAANRRRSASAGSCHSYRRRDQSRERSQDRSRKQSQERSQERSRERSIEHSRDHNQERSREHRQDHSRERSQDQSRERSRERSQDRSRKHSQERGQQRKRKRSREHSRNRSQEHSEEHSRERSGEHSRDRSREDRPKRSQDRSQERSQKRHQERSHDRESKKKKKERSSDHHSRDHKKKKKKDDREKEK